MTIDQEPDLDPTKLIDQLYDIALDTDALDTFIDAWNGAGLDAQSARQTITSIDSFDDAHSAHLKRAETFLRRGEDDGPSLASMLAPFKNLAAMIVDRAGRVVACNHGATLSFGLSDGDLLEAFQCSEAEDQRLRKALDALFRVDDKPDGMLKLNVG